MNDGQSVPGGQPILPKATPPLNPEQQSANQFVQTNPFSSLNNQGQDQVTGISQYQQPSYQNRAPQPVTETPQSISSGTGDIILSSSKPRNTVKKTVAIVLLAIVLLVFGIMTFVITKSNNNLIENKNTDNQVKQLSTKKDVYDALWEFNYWRYSKLLEHYIKIIGLTPNYKATDNTVIIPYASYLDRLNQELDEAIKYYDELSLKIPDNLSDDNIDLWQVKTDISNSLQAIKQNLTLIDKFYQAYYIPLVQGSYPRNCEKSQEMLNLEKGNTLEISEKYYSLYCEAVKLLNNSINFELLSTALAEKTTSATESLNQLLIDVPSASENINNLFEELTK